MHSFMLANDSVIPAGEKTLSPGQVGSVNGWGVFSTLRVHRGVLFAWERHYARMLRDARLLRVPFPADPNYMHSQLLKLVETLRDRKKDGFSWIVANETVSDVSVGGRFDFQEHPTLIPGASSGPDRPSVEHVFVGQEDLVGMGEWGVGANLPSLDDEDT